MPAKAATKADAIATPEHLPKNSDTAPIKADPESIDSMSTGFVSKEKISGSSNPDSMSLAI